RRPGGRPGTSGGRARPAGSSGTGGHSGGPAGRRPGPAPEPQAASRTGPEPDRAEAAAGPAAGPGPRPDPGRVEVRPGPAEARDPGRGDLPADSAAADPGVPGLDDLDPGDPGPGRRARDEVRRDARCCEAGLLHPVARAPDRGPDPAGGDSDTVAAGRVADHCAEPLRPAPAAGQPLGAGQELRPGPDP